MKNVLVFGAGLVFSRIKSELMVNYNILGLIDNNFEKQGTILDGLKVLPPKEIEEYDYDYVLVTVQATYEIIKQLENLKVDYYKIKVLIPDLGNTIFYDIDEDYSVRIEFQKLTFELKAKSDFVVLRDIFAEKDYDFFLNEKCIVIDIGMNIGLASIYFAQKDFVERVYSFEPFKQSFDRAEKNISLNPSLIEKIVTYNIGLSDVAEIKSFKYDDVFPGGLSTVKSEQYYASDATLVTLENASKHISKIIEFHENKKIVMKLDCEGAEFNILKDLSKTKILKNVNCILMEYHKDPTPIESVLKEYGFKYFLRRIPHNSVLGYIYAIK